MKTQSFSEIFYKVISFILIPSLIFLLTNCFDNSTDPKTNNEIKWQYGKKMTYQISSAVSKEIMDSLSGVTILFPAGGNGNLTITEITDGPKFIFENCKRFRIDFDGKESIQIKILKQNSALDFLYSFHENKYGSIENPSLVNNWWAVVAREENANYILYDIKLDTIKISLVSSGKNNIQEYTAPPTNYFAVYNIPQGTTQYNQLKYYKETVDQVIDLWLNNMSDDLRSRCSTLINGKLKYGLFLSRSNSYVALNESGLVPRIYYANIYLRANMTGRDALSAISHEVGHYLTHVMCGYDRYQNEIFGRIPKNWYGSSIDHTFGMYIEGRKYIVEDYPFFSEVLAKGDCDNSVFYTSNLSFPTILETKPSLCDYPSHEGFGVVVLASLIRKENKIYDFDYITSDRKNLTSVPVINCTAKDIIDNILSKGPATIIEELALVQQYLESRSDADFNRLPAILEPVGWSYNGSGTITDQSDNPLEKCAVQNICYISDKEIYRTTMSAYTSADGKFYLNRIFPGCSILRIFYNFDGGNYKDSVDYPLNVDWNNPTNVPLKLGNFKINKSNDEVLKDLNGTNYLEITFTYRSNYYKGNEPYKNLNNYWNPKDEVYKLIWNGYNFSVNGNYDDKYDDGKQSSTTKQTTQFSGSYNPKTFTLNLIYDKKMSNSGIDLYKNTYSSESHNRLVFKNIPISTYDNYTVNFSIMNSKKISDYIDDYIIYIKSHKEDSKGNVLDDTKIDLNKSDINTDFPITILVDFKKNK